MTVFVISKDGERLMPTTRCGKVRHLLKHGKAVIIKHNPFTIQLTYETTTHTQPIEFCEDTGYQHIGVSVKSQSREYVHAQYDLLRDEKQCHDDCRKYRRARRNRKTRYRKARFNNRAIPKGWLAPSLQNKADQHIKVFEKYYSVCPISKAIFEVGQFDTAVLEAVQAGKPIPSGVGYQQGEQYGIDTLREAVFQRDHYKCKFCGRSGLDDKDRAILHVHHALFWKGRHGNKLSELATCCEKCHTPANHKPGGKLFGVEVSIGRLEGAAFMNAVKWTIYNTAKAKFPGVQLSMTYGALTKRKRNDMDLPEAHGNDAYAMGEFHPTAMATEEHYQKRRRNNRILSIFYDAKYMDTRTKKIVPGQSLASGRINRNHKRSGENLHQYRGHKVSKGRVSIRRSHYPLRPGDVVLYNGERHVSKGIQNKGAYLKLDNGKVVATKKVTVLRHTNGWEKIVQAIHPRLSSCGNSRRGLLATVINCKERNMPGKT